MNSEQREPIDRKFTFCATCTEHGHEHSHMDAIVFLAKDKALPATLEFYYHRCASLGAKDEQLKGILLLKERVERYQDEHPDQVKVADVDIPDLAGILDSNEERPTLTRSLSLEGEGQADKDNSIAGILDENEK